MKRISLDIKKEKFIQKSYGSNKIIVAAPHHTHTEENKKGKNKKTTKNRMKSNGIFRMRDKNVGFLAFEIASHLKSTALVVANAQNDPNKENSSYLNMLNKLKPEILIEIHGHGGTKTKNDIEISCGNQELNFYSIRLAEKIKFYLKKLDNKELKKLKICGDFNSVYFKALSTLSLKNIKNQGGTPYHIECSAKIREKEKSQNLQNSQGSEKSSLSFLGKQVSKVIASAISDIHKI